MKPRPSPKEYQSGACRMAREYAPEISPCVKCGWPKMQGFRCKVCPMPPDTARANWRIEVSWNMDHGWLVDAPREDDGEMESSYPPLPEDVTNFTHRDAVAWGRQIAIARHLPLRIYHRTGGKVIDVPLSDIEP